jgi:hypothetical protein
MLDFAVPQSTSPSPPCSLGLFWNPGPILLHSNLVNQMPATAKIVYGDRAVGKTQRSRSPRKQVLIILTGLDAVWSPCHCPSIPW